MNRIAKFCFAASASLLCAQAAAQGMYKCKDAAGKITYSGSECHLLGLTSAGEVTGRANVTPALKVPPAPPLVLPPPPAPAASAEPVDSGAPKEGDRRCFVVKTGKGTATRCNDTPEKTD